jgi:hypothetical protein
MKLNKNVGFGFKKIQYQRETKLSDLETIQEH